MPIYAYRCAACGHTKDVLRKLSDPPLAECPACGEPRFEKQVTAAGFQLKGSGWYVTDFRNPPAASATVAAKTEADKSADGKADKPEKAEKGEKADKAVKSGSAGEGGAPASTAAAAPAPATQATAPSTAAAPGPAGDAR